jgi:hypothetical protein
MIVSSARDTNGGYPGGLRAFDLDGNPQGFFGRDMRIADPRGLRVDGRRQLLYVNSGTDHVLAVGATGRIVYDSGPIPGLDPGGGNWGPNDRYYVGLRRQRTIVSFDRMLNGPPQPALPPAAVPFPRGFAIASDGRLFLSSGIGPSGQGDNTICVFGTDGELLSARFIEDPEISPLDLAIAPTGNVVVSSECPFGAADAVCSVREYDIDTGELVRVFKADDGFRSPRGLRFGPDGNLYCVSRDAVVAFDFKEGDYIGSLVRLQGLNGQALEFFA